MRVLYSKVPPKSRVKKFGISGTCFSLNWDNIAKGAQLFRQQWLKQVSARGDYRTDVEFEAVHITDEGVTFYLKEPFYDFAEEKPTKREGRRKGSR